MFKPIFSDRLRAESSENQVTVFFSGTVVPTWRYRRATTERFFSTDWVGPVIIVIGMFYLIEIMLGAAPATAVAKLLRLRISW